MAEELTRDFKGVWIPKELWLDENINKTEMLLLVEAHSLSLLDKGCIASNQHFADFLGISKDRVSKVISSLAKKGYLISNVTRDEKNKVVSRVLTIPSRRKQPYPLGENDHTPMVENDQENNTYKNNTKEIGAKAPTSKLKKEFVPPTKEEVQNHVDNKIASGCSEYKTIDVDKFYNYYSEGDWHMSNGRKVTRWKQCLVTWLKKNDSKPTEQQRPIVKSTLPEMTDEEKERLRRTMYGES